MANAQSRAQLSQGGFDCVSLGRVMQWASQHPDYPRDGGVHDVRHGKEDADIALVIWLGGKFFSVSRPIQIGADLVGHMHGIAVL